MPAFQDAIFAKTLICFLQALEGQKCTVDLRNESTLTGRLQSVDSFMNLQVDEATVTDALGTKRCFASLFVKGKQIRYVEIPENLDVSSVLRSQLSSYYRRRTKRPLSHLHRSERFVAKTST